MKRIVITPVHNEQSTIETMLDTIWPQIDILIVIEDGSTDNSRSQVEAWIQTRRGGYFITSPTRLGQSTALKRGYALVHNLLQQGFIQSQDPVVEIDSDGQHDPEYITPLIDFWQESEADVVLARRDFAGYPLYKLVGNLGLTTINSLLIGQRLFDAVSNFRVASAQARSDLLQYYIGYCYSGSFEANIILAGLGYKIDNSFKIHVPLYRTGARAKDGWHIVWTGLRTWHRVRTRKPIRGLETFMSETLADLVFPKREIGSRC